MVVELEIIEVGLLESQQIIGKGTVYVGVSKVQDTPPLVVVYAVWLCMHPCAYVPGVSTYVGGLTVGLPDTRVLF
jgi:hypothetical protein